MDWLKPSLLVLTFIGGFVTECSGHADFNFEVVQRYEQCVLNRLSKSRYFTEEEWVRMVKIAYEANYRMHLLYIDPTNTSNARTILHLFAAALANLVAENDIPENPQKDAYMNIIKTCSSSLPQATAEELICGVERIFASAEIGKISGSGGNASPLLSRRKEISPESSSRPIITDDSEPRQRSKRSPQAEAFSTSFGGWQPTESLQTVLSNILLNSNTFSNVFKAGMSRRDARYYSGAMVEAGLDNYHFSVIREAVNNVLNAVSTFPFRPETLDYAIAIAHSIASVLEARQLSFFADGVGIGNGLVSKLQTMLDNRTPSVSFPARSDAVSSFPQDASGGSVTNQQRTVSGFQLNSGNVESKQSSAVFPSSQSDTEQFQRNLSFLLYQSNKLQGAFCNGPFQGIFDMVKEALSEYGLPISITAGTIVTDSLTSMGSDLACAQFGNVISETVTNILRENNLLQSANASLIAEKMALNLNPHQEFKTSPTQNGKDFGSQAFSSSFSGPQQEPAFLPEFSLPEMQPSAFSPEFQFEPPQYSDSGVLPFNPNIKDSFGTQVFPFETTDNVRIPVQETKMSEDYSLPIPSFEPVVPDDYIVDTSESMSGTDIAIGQENGSDSAKSDSRTVESDGHRFEPIDDSFAMKNPPIPSPVDSRTQKETGPRNATNTFQSNANSEFKDNGTTTTLLQNKTLHPKDREDIQTSTTLYPYTSTAMDSSKLAEILLDDIFESLRTLNSSSEDDKHSQISSDSSTIENRDSSAILESTTIQDNSYVDKVEPIETEFTTISSVSDEVSPIKQESTVDLEPSFWPTAPPNSKEGSPDSEFKNGTQTSEDKPEDELELRDPTLVFAEHVSSIATSSIAMIRSGNMNLQELCKKLNDLAPVVDIPPLDACNEIAFVDYLLNVLKAVTFILRSV